MLPNTSIGEDIPRLQLIPPRVIGGEVGVIRVPEHFSLEADLSVELSTDDVALPNFVARLVIQAGKLHQWSV
jgi:hypothetical protein